MKNIKTRLILILIQLLLIPSALAAVQDGFELFTESKIKSIELINHKSFARDIYQEDDRERKKRIDQLTKSKVDLLNKTRSAAEQNASWKCKILSETQMAKSGVFKCSPLDNTIKHLTYHVSLYPPEYSGNRGLDLYRGDVIRINKEDIRIVRAFMEDKDYPLDYNKKYGTRFSVQMDIYIDTGKAYVINDSNKVIDTKKDVEENRERLYKALNVLWEYFYRNFSNDKCLSETVEVGVTELTFINASVDGNGFDILKSSGSESCDSKIIQTLSRTFVHLKDKPDVIKYIHNITIVFSKKDAEELKAPTNIHNVDSEM